MANRLMANRVYSHEKDLKIVNMQLLGAGNGTIPVLQAGNSKGVASIARPSTAGLYDVQFGTLVNGVVQADPYVKLLAMMVTLFQVATFAAATSTIGGYLVNGSNAINSTGIVRIQLLSGTDAAVDPAANDLVNVTFFMGDSTAP